MYQGASTLSQLLHPSPEDQEAARVGKDALRQVWPRGRQAEGPEVIISFPLLCSPLSDPPPPPQLRLPTPPPQALLAGRQPSRMKWKMEAITWIFNACCPNE